MLTIAGGIILGGLGLIVILAILGSLDGTGCAVVMMGVGGLLALAVTAGIAFLCWVFWDYEATKYIAVALVILPFWVYIDDRKTSREMKKAGDELREKWAKEKAEKEAD